MKVIRLHIDEVLANWMKEKHYSYNEIIAYGIKLKELVDTMKEGG